MQVSFILAIQADRKNKMRKTFKEKRIFKFDLENDTGRSKHTQILNNQTRKKLNKRLFCKNNKMICIKRTCTILYYTHTYL